MEEGKSFMFLVPLVIIFFSHCYLNKVPHIFILLERNSESNCWLGLEQVHKPAGRAPSPSPPGWHES